MLVVSSFLEKSSKTLYCILSQKGSAAAYLFMFFTKYLLIANLYSNR